MRAFNHRSGAVRRRLAFLLASSALCAGALPAIAQDATWLNAPGSTDFNTAANWSPATVPTGTAFFGASNVTALTFSALTVSIGGLTFNSGAPAYSFTTGGLGANLTQSIEITGAGIINGGNATITNYNQLGFINSASAGSATIVNTFNGVVGFNHNSTAGNATINNDGTLRIVDNATAGSATIDNTGQIQLYGTAGNATIFNHNARLDISGSAGNATIVNEGSMGIGGTGGNATIINNNQLLVGSLHSTAGNANIINNGITYFADLSSAGDANITNNNLVLFRDICTCVHTITSTGGNAAITNSASGITDFSPSTGPNNDHKLSAGSLNGGGIFRLGRNELTVGSNNLSTNVTGTIEDGSQPVGGRLIKVGTGIMTLSSINTYTGGTTFAGGAISVSSDAYLGGAAGSLTFDGGALQVTGTAFNSTPRTIAWGLSGGTFDIANAANNFTVSQTLTGGQLTKSGAGTLTLPAYNTFTGATVNGGTLVVSGSMATASLITVNSGGTLTGTGIVSSTLVTGGTFAPGSGTPGSFMVVDGSLGFDAAATYVVNVNPTNSSFSHLSGTATLGGATVNAKFAPGSYISQRYMIVSAGSISGTFGTLTNTNLPANFHDTLSYDATHAYLNLDLNFTALAGGGNGNQNNVANALINYFNSTGGIPMPFGTLSPSGLSQAAGETATGSQQTTIGAMTQFMGIMSDPFSPGRGGSTNAPGYAEEDLAANAHAFGREAPIPGSRAEREAYASIYSKAPLARNYDPRWSVWAAGFGGSQTTDGNAAQGSNSSTSRLFGVVAGADYIFSPRTIAGFALAGGGSSFSVVNGGSGRSDLFQAGAFVRHTAGQSYVTGALAYGWQDVTTDRTVTIAGVDRLRAQFNANAFSGRAEGGYRFVSPWTGGVGITPYAAAQFTTFDLPAYAEQVVSGANTFALAYGSRSITATRSELGLRADKSFALQTAILTLRGRAAWAHDFNPDRAIGATFQALPGASFLVNGARQASDSALVTASAEAKWMNGWSATATFEGEFSQVTRSYAGKGVVRYEW